MSVEITAAGVSITCDEKVVEQVRRSRKSANVSVSFFLADHIVDTYVQVMTIRHELAKFKEAAEQLMSSDASFTKCQRDDGTASIFRGRR